MIYSDRLKQANIANSKINSAFNKQNDQTKCIICGKDIKMIGKSFHKSHTVPFFCLENIKSEYKKNTVILNTNRLFPFSPLAGNVSNGTSKAGIFYLICSECDQNKFSVYENEDALLNENPRNLFDAIVLKTYLKELFDSNLIKFKNSIDYNTITDDDLIKAYLNAESMLKRTVNQLDISKFEEEIERAKKGLEKGYGNYKLIYHEILDYTVPIAAQTAIPVSRNVDYSKIQDVTDTNKLRIEELIVCVFPLKNKSVIFLLTRLDNKQMKIYSKQFKKLSHEEKLKEIFYLLIRYKATNYYFSPLVNDILDDYNIRSICSIEDVVMHTKTRDGKKFQIDMGGFEEKTWKKELPSLLSEKYSIQNLRKDSI